MDAVTLEDPGISAGSWSDRNSPITGLIHLGHTSGLYPHSLPMFAKSTRIVLPALAALLVAAPAASAAQKPKSIKLSWVRCFSVKEAKCTGESTVTAGGALKLAVVAGPKARVVLRTAKGSK